MWSFNLAKQHPNITIIAVNPGSLLNTNMVKEGYGYHWASADKGANILVDLALGDHRNNSGKYFDNDLGDFGMAHQDAYNTTLIEQLLDTTEAITNNL